MKYALIVSLVMAAASSAFAASTTAPLPNPQVDPAPAQEPAPMAPNMGYSPYSPLSSRVEEKSMQTDNNGHPYDQLLTIQAGPYKPKSVNFTNWNAQTFDYDSSQLGSFSAELGWGIKMFRLGGTAFYFNEGLSWSSFSLTAPASVTGAAPNQGLTLHMFGFDSRISQSWETFPIASLEPFWEAGVLVTLYDQSAPSDLLSGEGTATNVVAGAGLRYWVNRGSSVNKEFPNRYMSLPIFLTAKVNQIFSNNQGVDPASTNVMAGISIGL